MPNTSQTESKKKHLCIKLETDYHFKAHRILVIVLYLYTILLLTELLVRQQCSLFNKGEKTNKF